MGLNLLEVVMVQFPSFGQNFDARELGKDIPAALKAYAAGLAFALAASPCSTPVLATLLGYVASSGDPVTGGALLFTYTSGYVRAVTRRGDGGGEPEKHHVRAPVHLLGHAGVRVRARRGRDLRVPHKSRAVPQSRMSHG